MHVSIINRFVLVSFLAVLAGCAGTGGQGSRDGGGSGSGFPWSSSRLKIGYIRSDMITQRYRDYQDADNALQTENRKWLNEVEDMKREITKKETDLEELSLILSDEQKKQLEDELVEGRKALQRFQHETWYDENSQYIKKRRELMEPIDARVNDAIWRIAEDEGFDLIFDTIAGNIVYVKPEFDITEKVLEELQE